MPSPRPYKTAGIMEHSEWFQRITQDDHEAFKAVFHSFYPQLCSFIRRFVPSSEVAQELVQNVFEKLWMKRHEIEIHTSLKAYLYRGVRNQAIDYIKHRKVVQKWEEDPASHEFTPKLIDEEYHRKELLAAVENAIQTLPERRRIIFTLHWSEGLTYSEIADVLGLSVKTVEAQMGNALKTLRSLLSEFIPLIAALSVLSLTNV
jgi:RNA polymerase sigma-70 factor, ECF subfamily